MIIKRKINKSLIKETKIKDYQYQWKLKILNKELIKKF